jgi:hypothetical protein
VPNRIIKESICTSKNLNQLSAEEEVFFYRLIVNADDFGRFDAEPEILRARCFPRRTSFITIEQVLNWLNALVKAELIALYEVDGDLYGYFVTWDDHQQKRAKHSKYPDPTDGVPSMITDDIKCNQTPSNVPENRESRIREYENRESNICASDGCASAQTNSKPESVPEKDAPVPYSEIVEVYHEQCPDLPKVLKVTTARKKHIKARYREYNSDLSVFRELFKLAGSSPFLHGKNDRGWIASFDWLMNEQNMTKVLEGKYTDRGPPTREPPPRNNLPVVSFE